MAGRVVVMTPGPGRVAGETVIDGASAPARRLPDQRPISAPRSRPPRSAWPRSWTAPRDATARPAGARSAPSWRVWEAAVRVTATPAYLLPAPSAIAQALAANAGR